MAGVEERGNEEGGWNTARSSH